MSPWWLLVLLPPIIHEAAHWGAALVLGHKIHFRLEWAKVGPIPIPRGVWDMPDVDIESENIIASLGFVAEFVFGIYLFAADYLPYHVPPVYMVIAALHLIFYRAYADESSDLDKMGPPKEGDPE